MAINIQGTTKGIFGINQAITGLVVHSVSFNSKVDETDFYNQDADVTSVGFTNATMDFSIDGELLAGTSFTGTVASVVTLSGIPAHMPSGYTGTTAITNSINLQTEFKSWQKLTMSGRVLPKVVIA